MLDRCLEVSDGRLASAADRLEAHIHVRRSATVVLERTTSASNSWGTASMSEVIFWRVRHIVSKYVRIVWRNSPIVWRSARVLQEVPPTAAKSDAVA